MLTNVIRVVPVVAIVPVLPVVHVVAVEAVVTVVGVVPGVLKTKTPKTLRLENEKSNSNSSIWLTLGLTRPKVGF